VPRDFLNQFFPRADRKYSGELRPGEPVKMTDVFSGKQEEADKLKKQLGLERKLRAEEKELIEKKTQELKLKLGVIIQEIRLVAQKTQKIDEGVKIATLQIPAEPGVYHINFFEKLYVLGYFPRKFIIFSLGVSSLGG